MSAMSGSSGLGSAMSSWMEASTVAMLRDGRQAPCAQTRRLRDPEREMEAPARSHSPAARPAPPLTLGGNLRTSRQILPAESMFG